MKLPWLPLFLFFAFVAIDAEASPNFKTQSRFHSHQLPSNVSCVVEGINTNTTCAYDQQKRRVEYCVTTQLLGEGDEFSYFQIPCVQPSFNQFIKTAALYLAKSRAFNTQRRSVCYFPDEHEQQPSSSSIKDGCTGQRWFCDEKWSIISRTNLFVSKVSGTPIRMIENTDEIVTLSRGSKGLFAMIKKHNSSITNLTVETNLPEGTYCNLINDCETLIQVETGGIAKITFDNTTIKVVAICVGCYTDVIKMPAGCVGDCKKKEVLDLIQRFRSVKHNTSETIYKDSYVDDGINCLWDNDCLWEDQVFICNLATSPPIDPPTTSPITVPPTTPLTGPPTTPPTKPPTTSPITVPPTTPPIDPLTTSPITVPPTTPTTGPPTTPPTKSPTTTPSSSATSKTYILVDPSTTTSTTTQNPLPIKPTTTQPPTTTPDECDRDESPCSFPLTTTQPTTPKPTTLKPGTCDPNEHSCDFKATTKRPPTIPTAIKTCDPLIDENCPSSVGICGPIDYDCTADPICDPIKFPDGCTPETSITKEPVQPFTEAPDVGPDPCDVDATAAPGVCGGGFKCEGANSPDIEVTEPPPPLKCGDPDYVLPPPTKHTRVFVVFQGGKNQHVFIRGGGLNDTGNQCPPDTISRASPFMQSRLKSIYSIPIKHNLEGLNLTARHVKSMVNWAKGDTLLDYCGAEIGQGKFEGNVAVGTPLLKTTNVTNCAFEHDANIYASVAWMLDVEMDCSFSYKGWFKFKIYITNWSGSDVGIESDVFEPTCLGTACGTSPLPKDTGFHFARCGYDNVVYPAASQQCKIYGNSPTE